MDSIFSTKSDKLFRDHEQVDVMHIRPKADRMHSHAFFELVYVMHGSAVHRLGSDAARLSEGDYFIIDMGSFHCYQENDAFEIVNCLFLPEYVDRALINCPSLSALLSNKIMRFGVPIDTRPADRIYHDQDGSIRRLVEALEREFEKKQVGCMEMVRCYLTEILVHAARLADKGETTRERHPAVAAMAEYLYEHYAQPLSLELLSERIGYTPQYLSSLFRKESGMSPSAYLQRLRVENACLLLSERRLSISQIAQEVGYGDLKHFNAVFRRYKNMSPREFRACTEQQS